MFTKKKLKKELKIFLQIYEKRPIEINKSGMRIEHCFALFCFLRKIKPKTIIESGIWKGQTTWLIRKTLSNTKIFAIDTDLNQRQIIFKDVTYLDKDITLYKWNKINKKTCLILFDDHVCFSKRIDFLLKNNFKHIVFDDNLPKNFISYYTPKMIYEEGQLIIRKYISYSNLKRFFLFLFNYFFLKKYNKSFTIKFNNSFVEIVNKDFLYKKNKLIFKKFKKKIKNYYEFPPLFKFNLKKRFSKVIDNFNFDIKNFTYIYKKPIFLKKIL